MDIDDVSGVEQYTGFLNGQKATLEAAKARDGELPTDRKSKSELIARHKQAAMADMVRKLALMGRKDVQIRSSFLPPPYLPSVARLDELQPIHIRDLRLGTHHRGHYLLVRSVVAAPNRMTAILSVVEDELKDALTIQLYQQPEEKDRPASNIIADGDVFIVKEPFFKVMSDGEYGLRVDHISDLIRITGQHRFYPKQWVPHQSRLGMSADAWKKEGNASFGSKRYWDAAERYTLALASSPSPSEETVIRLNRAQAYLNDHNFEAALADIRCLAAEPSSSEKALYRAGKALYGLGKFAECCDIFKTLCEKYPNSPDGPKELDRARSRLAEQTSGNYDWKSIYNEVARIRPPHLDHATYVGFVAVKDSPGKGQGLFTTKDVKAGDLLVCEKAFAHCYADSLEGVSNSTLLINMHTNRMTMGTQGDLITVIVQKLLRNPSLLSEFVALHHGSYESASVTEVDGSPIIDTFLVERIIVLNGFGCPLTSKDSHMHGKKSDNQYHSTGVWPLASKINHSCMSNVRRSFIGDLQIIHATSDMPAGTELSFWYHNPNGDHYKMQKGLQNWGFQCDCVICVDSKNTPNKTLRKRTDLMGDFRTATDVANPNTAKAERLLSAIGDTYKHPPSVVPRLEMQEVYFPLIAIYSKQSKAGKVVAISIQALESLGFVIKGALPPFMPGESFVVEKWGIMVDEVVRLLVNLWNAYAALAPHLRPKVEEFGRLAYRMCVGEDVTFKESYDSSG